MGVFINTLPLRPGRAEIRALCTDVHTGIDDSTAPMADECQSFWRMLLLSLGADKPLAWMAAAAACATLTGRGGTMLSNAWLSKADRQVLSAALGSGMEVCGTRGNDKAYSWGGENR